MMQSYFGEGQKRGYFFKNYGKRLSLVLHPPYQTIHRSLYFLKNVYFIEDQIQDLPVLGRGG